MILCHVETAAQKIQNKKVKPIGWNFHLLAVVGNGFDTPSATALQFLGNELDRSCLFTVTGGWNDSAKTDFPLDGNKKGIYELRRFGFSFFFLLLLKYCEYW